MTSPATLNFLESANNACIKGVTFRQVVTVYDDEAGTDLSDLTGLSGRVRILDGDTEIWEGTTAGGEVVITVVDATFAFTISADDTDGFGVGSYHIDMDLIDTAASPDEVDRIAHGEFQVVQ